LISVSLAFYFLLNIWRADVFGEVECEHSSGSKRRGVAHVSLDRPWQGPSSRRSHVLYSGHHVRWKPHGRVGRPSWSRGVADSAASSGSVTGKTPLGSAQIPRPSSSLSSTPSSLPPSRWAGPNTSACCKQGTSMSWVWLTGRAGEAQQPRKTIKRAFKVRPPSCTLGRHS